MPTVEQNVIGAFSEDQVEKITGLSVRKLSHWSRTGFFVPAYVAEDVRIPFSRIYSFLDVVALRVIKKLRDDYKVPLQHLRKVSQKLAGMSSAKWVNTNLYVLNKKVVFAEPESEKFREIVSGQYVMAMALGVEIENTHAAIDNLKKRNVSHIGVVSRNKFVHHNSPVISGTRIPTAAIWRFYKAGYTAGEIMSEYPDLTEADISAAIMYHIDEMKGTTA